MRTNKTQGKQEKKNWHFPCIFFLSFTSYKHSHTRSHCTYSCPCVAPEHGGVPGSETHTSWRWSRTLCHLCDPSCGCTWYDLCCVSASENKKEFKGSSSRNCEVGENVRRLVKRSENSVNQVFGSFSKWLPVYEQNKCEFSPFFQNLTSI